MNHVSSIILVLTTTSILQVFAQVDGMMPIPCPPPIPVVPPPTTPPCPPGMPPPPYPPVVPPPSPPPPSPVPPVYPPVTPCPPSPPPPFYPPNVPPPSPPPPYPPVMPPSPPYPPVMPPPPYPPVMPPPPPYPIWPPCPPISPPPPTVPNPPPFNPYPPPPFLPPWPTCPPFSPVPPPVPPPYSPPPTSPCPPGSPPPPYVPPPPYAPPPPFVPPPSPYPPGPSPPNPTPGPSPTGPPQTQCNGLKAYRYPDPNSNIEQTSCWTVIRVTGMPQPYPQNFDISKNVCSVYSYVPQCQGIRWCEDVKTHQTAQTYAFYDKTQDLVIYDEALTLKDPNYAIFTSTVLKMNYANKDGAITPVNPVPQPVIQLHNEKMYAVVHESPEGKWRILRTCDQLLTWVIVPTDSLKDPNYLQTFNPQIDVALQQLGINVATVVQIATTLPFEPPVSVATVSKLDTAAPATSPPPSPPPPASPPPPSGSPHPPAQAPANAPAEAVPMMPVVFQ